MKMRKKILLSLASLLFSPPLYAGTHFSKVVWIVFENENSGVVESQTDFAKFAKYGTLFTNFFGEFHPSQPNYISMVAGSNLGVTTDSNVTLSQNHVGDLLEAAKMDWHVYAENFPGKCFSGATSGDYARRHVPFMSFSNVTSSSARCAKISDATNFFQNLKAGTLPAFTMYIPNVDDDGHDTGVTVAGAWLTKNFTTILDEPSTLGDTLFILTFDESEQNNPVNNIYTLLVGKNVKVGTNNQKLNHIALLKMIEDELKIGNLGRQDETAPAITNIWTN